MQRSTCAYRRMNAHPIQEFTGVDCLTEREKEVFLLLATGLSNRQLSGELRIAERTVKMHVARIVDKLGQETRLQASILAALAHNSLCIDADCSCRRTAARPTAA
ncbi:LuxR C-terminal-related transcriptional regulator [Streptomyces sp. cg40]|uniref:LuxR C-terminal-related transcriptional regulator n=1 Tax=Streptomyces sp. cg40 TaxID=3419764 RepID=UPI003D04653B